MVQESTQALSYRDAGVDIDAGDALVERIKPFARKTLRDGVLSGLGGFGALFEVPKRYRGRCWCRYRWGGYQAQVGRRTESPRHGGHRSGCHERQ